MATARLFGAMTLTDIAPVAALPTTTAHFCIWNGEKVGGKTYTITSIGIVITTSAAAAIVLQLLAQVAPNNTVPVISGTAASAALALDGQGPGSRAMAASAVTIVNAGFWHPVGQSIVSAATANIGLGSWVNVNGLYRIPPGGLFSLAGFCSAAGSAKCQLMATWSEA